MNAILALYFAAVSLLAVFLTVRDKNAARKHAWRVRERTLLVVSAFGGSAAAFLTMLAVRHKTRRAKFMVGAPFMILAQAAIFAFVFILPLNGIKAFDEKEYRYGLTAFAELESVPVIAQETEHTCYAAAMAIVWNYLGFDTTEKELLEELGFRDRTTGLLPDEFVSYSNTVFCSIGYTVSLVNPKSQSEILNIITASLLEGFPVIIYYSVEDDWNRPDYDTHYSVVYGIDMSEKNVKISNPYGYTEEMPFEDFFGALAFENYKSEPLPHLLGRKIGYIKYNNIFIFKVNAEKTSSEGNG